MDPTIQTRRMSAEELWNLGAEAERFELDEGELIEMSPAGPWHGAVEGEVHDRLRQHLRQNPIGMLLTGDPGFQLEKDLVRAPDIAFLGRERLLRTPIPKSGWYPGAPDLAIEILSPEDRAGEVLRKVSRFLDAGTRLVWVVDPLRFTVTVYRPNGEFDMLGQDEVLSGEDVLPGFTCRVAELFPTPVT
jgi:Uma2 family endonuclease